MTLDKVRSIVESEAILKSNETLINTGIGLVNTGAWNTGNELKYMRDNENYKQKGYNTFKEYIEEELPYKRRQAYNFIKIAETYSVHSIAQTPNIGITKLLSLTTLEDEERNSFIENNPVDEMSTRELKEAINEGVKERLKIKEVKNSCKETLEDLNEMLEGMGRGGKNPKDNKAPKDFDYSNLTSADERTLKESEDNINKNLDNMVKGKKELEQILEELEKKDKIYR